MGYNDYYLKVINSEMDDLYAKTYKCRHLLYEYGCLKIHDTNVFLCTWLVERVGYHKPV